MINKTYEGFLDFLKKKSFKEISAEQIEDLFIDLLDDDLKISIKEEAKNNIEILIVKDHNWFEKQFRNFHRTHGGNYFNIDFEINTLVIDNVNFALNYIQKEFNYSLKKITLRFEYDPTAESLNRDKKEFSSLKKFNKYVMNSPTSAYEISIMLTQ